MMIIPWNPLPRHYHCRNMDRNNNDYDLDYDALFSGRDFTCCSVDGVASG